MPCVGSGFNLALRFIPLPHEDLKPVSQRIKFETSGCVTDRGLASTQKLFFDAEPQWTWLTRRLSEKIPFVLDLKLLKVVLDPLELPFDFVFFDA